MQKVPSESKQTVLILGATGLVGGHVLHMALADERIANVVAPTRKPLRPHAKLNNPVLDFNPIPDDAAWWTADAVICALGTTIAKAGSKEAFRKVDFDLPLHIARLCRQRGAQAFALNSALGADSASRVFYSRVKGELEDAMQSLGYPSLTIVRPGLLGGDRKENRPAERAGIMISHWLAPLLPKRYRVVPADRVAHHLLEGALAARPGTAVIPSEDLV